jgi:hypothetical protein
MSFFEILGTVIGMTLVIIPDPITTPAGLAILTAIYATHKGKPKALK